MRVAYLTNQYPKVSHTFIRREVASLEEEGLLVDRFSIRSTPDKLVDEKDLEELAKTKVILKAGIPTIVWGLVRCAITQPNRLMRAALVAVKFGWTSDRGVARHLAYLAEACVLLAWCRQRHCEHIHAHFGTNPAMVAMLCRMLGGPPFSFTVHGPEEFDKPFQIGLAEKIRRAKFVAGVSSFGRSQLFRRVEYRFWSKLKVVRCGLDKEYLDVKPSEVPDVQRLVCVGRICEQKGQILLCEAAKRLFHEGVQFELVLVGDGEMRQDVEAFIASEGLEDRIQITGWASGEAVREHLVASRATVLPSFGEGLPVVIMESLALGRPVVSTYIAGIPELVEPGKSGWLVPAGSVDALVDTLRDVLEVPVDELNRVGSEGRRRVLALHDISNSARELKRLFEER